MTKHVLFDCERMRKPYTGLFYYNLYLGKHLIKVFEREKDIQLLAYTAPSQKGILGQSPVCSYVQQKKIHKLFHPSTKHIHVWHCTFQASDYFPFGESELKVVLTIHDLNFMYDDAKTEDKKQRYLRRLKRKICRADHIIVISEFVKQDLIYHGLFPEGKPVTVIYNSHCLGSTALAKDFKPSFVPPKPFLFSIGTIARKKNFHILPALLEGNDLHLVIAGAIVDKGYLEEIHQAIRAWMVEDRVTILPPVSEEEKTWYYQHCEAFVFLSLSEGFGIPVIEAMSFGKPVLLSRLTSLPEVGGEHAFYVDDFEPQHMREQLQQCLKTYDSDPLMRERIVAHTQQFSWEKAAQEHLKVYQSFF